MERNGQSGEKCWIWRGRRALWQGCTRKVGDNAIAVFFLYVIRLTLTMSLSFNFFCDALMWCRPINMILRELKISIITNFNCEKKWIDEIFTNKRPVDMNGHLRTIAHNKRVEEFHFFILKSFIKDYYTYNLAKNLIIVIKCNTWYWKGATFL